MKKLTQKQKRLIVEFDELISLFGLNPQNNTSVNDTAWRTTQIEFAKNQIIRSEVVMLYTLVDELLNVRIAHYYFGKKRPFQVLWRTKRFQIFNYHVLEELSLLSKLRLVKAIKKVPKAIASEIEKLNALRNGLVHAFFPGNLRKARPEWKGVNIFSINGVRRLKDDMQKVIEYFCNEY